MKSKPRPKPAPLAHPTLPSRAHRTVRADPASQDVLTCAEAAAAAIPIGGKSESRRGLAVPYCFLSLVSSTCDAARHCEANSRHRLVAAILSYPRALLFGCNNTGTRVLQATDEVEVVTCPQRVQHTGPRARRAASSSANKRVCCAESCADHNVAAVCTPGERAIAYGRDRFASALAVVLDGPSSAHGGARRANTPLHNV